MERQIQDYTRLAHAEENRLIEIGGKVCMHCFHEQCNKLRICTFRPLAESFFEEHRRLRGTNLQSLHCMSDLTCTLQQANVEPNELRDYCATLEHSMGAFLADIADFQAFYTQVGKFKAHIPLYTFST